MRIHTRRAAGRARGAVAAAVLALPVAASVLAAVPAGAGALSGHMPASAGLALAGSMQTGQAGAGSLVPGRPGTQRWVARYAGPTGRFGYDEASSVMVSPDGDTVFVAGTSTGASSGEDYVTVAYRAATGAQLWLKRYDGPGYSYNSSDQALSAAVSPAGDLVFVTGRSQGRAWGVDYATVAYDAATGAQRWVARYNGPANRLNMAASVAVSPAGDTVFVTGHSEGRASGFDYATVAYDAVTGAQRWVARYNGPGNSDDAAFSMAVSPHGNTVYVTGSSAGRGSGQDYATVAYKG